LTFLNIFERQGHIKTTSVTTPRVRNGGFTMKRLSFIVLLLALPLSTPAWAQADTWPDGLGKDLSTPEGLRKLIERKDPRLVIVDVRPPAEYAAGHIPTAINIPGGITADMKAPPSKDKYLVLYCHGGMRSPAAGEKMRADGYPHVFVWGGIVNWPYPREPSTK
jgi:phage shock protein E